MKVVFRADASLQIGTGHIMRCLTLADTLAAKGADCQFICRAHEGNLIEFIRSKGYITHSLPIEPTCDVGFATINPGVFGADLVHSHWLGATQSQDAEACSPILQATRPDWMIVDHYALDACWEQALAPNYGQLMVIDDLADRKHLCDLLLDQTFGRDSEDYHSLVPAGCRLLCGSQYALLRPEFAALRPYSLQRRSEPRLRHLLITMGGVDKDNITGQVLVALRESLLPADCRITVVMGATAPWLVEVERLAQGMPWPTQVRVGVRDMARLMADSDLAIGAAGTTAWERACLGLPSLTIVVADNQRAGADALENAGCICKLELSENISSDLKEALVTIVDAEMMVAISRSCAVLTDGLGANLVVGSLMEGM